jgi:hypothetical protein
VELGLARRRRSPGRKRRRVGMTSGSPRSAAAGAGARGRLARLLGQLGRLLRGDGLLGGVGGLRGWLWCWAAAAYCGAGLLRPAGLAKGDGLERGKG